MRSFKSFGEIRDALETNALSPGVKGIIYDYEKWRFTPEEEQKNPARYVKQAADIVHAYGCLFFTAPAVDLVAGSGAEQRPKTSGRDLFAGGHCRRRRPVCRRLRHSIATVRARYEPLRKFVEGSCGASASGKSEDYRARRRKYSAEWPACNSQRHSAGLSTQLAILSTATGSTFPALRNTPRRVTEFRPDIAVDVLRGLARQ